MSSTDWDWIEEGAEARRSDYVGEISDVLPPLELHYWTDDEYRQAITDKVMPCEDLTESALEHLRSQLSRRHRIHGKGALEIRAAGLCSIISAETLFTVWGLHVDSPYCVVQYIEHRVDGSRVWAQELGPGFELVGEWEVLHTGYMQRIPPIFPLHSAGHALPS